MRTEGLQDICRVRPEIPEIMAEIFSEYEFVFGNERMLPSEVFSTMAFLPVMSHIACQRIREIFDLPFMIDLENNDSALLGVEVRPQFHRLSALMIYLSTLLSTSIHIFGCIPTTIELDKLYEWAVSDADNITEVPYLGVRHGKA